MLYLHYHFCACRSNLHLPPSISICRGVFWDPSLLPCAQQTRSVGKLMLPSSANDWQEFVYKYQSSLQIILMCFLLVSRFPQWEQDPLILRRNSLDDANFGCLSFPALPIHSNTYRRVYFRGTQTVMLSTQ